jgi:hypothetical protein
MLTKAEGGTRRGSATFWFLVLKAALARNELSKAGRAQEELRRKGIDVRFRRLPQRRVEKRRGGK